MSGKPSLQIRPMTPDDISAIVAMEKRCFTTPWTSHAFRMELKNHLAVYQVASLDGQVMGYGGMWLILDEAHVTNVAVHPQARGRGIGKALMKTLIQETVDRRLKRMTLEVRKSNETALAMYRKLGFRMSGIRPGYYQDTGEDALIMWLDLEQ